MLLTARDVLRKVKDASGHEHDEQGRFTASAGAEVPDSVADHPDDRHAVFMIGGTGAGKSSYVRGYVGNEGDERKDGTRITRDDTDHIAPWHGFSKDRSYDADSIKERIPLYSHVEDKDGMYGASGPRDADELAQYPHDKVVAMQKFVQENTPFKSIADFAKNCISGSGSNFGGGLTHEVSWWIARQGAEAAVHDPKGASFMYDSTGGNSHVKMAAAALKNGYRVTFHHVDTPAGVALMRNDRRERRVKIKFAIASHKRIRGVAPTIKKWARDQAASGERAHFYSSRNDTQHERDEAQRLGYDDML